MNTMTYKGYTARVEYDERDKRGSLYKTAFRSGFVFGGLAKGGDYRRAGDVPATCKRVRRVEEIAIGEVD